MRSEPCRICGATMEMIIVREAIAGGNGLYPIAAIYDWDHKSPDDCLRTINEKLDYLIGRICPNNGQEG